MSRSKKDGVQGGGHRNTQNKEVWSKRFAKVNMWPLGGRWNYWYKMVTHRHERRQARREILAALSEAA